jgi:replicative DNA helicase
MSQSEETTPAQNAIPHSRESEEATIGGVLINPEIWFDLSFLAPADFYIHRNKFIWEAFIRLNDQRTPIDLLTVSDELERSGKLADVGGSAYITSLINQVPSSLNAESYGRIVERYSARRKMIAAANKIATAAYNTELSTEEAQEIANQEIAAASVSETGDEGDAFSRAISKVYDRAQANAEKTRLGQPIITGIKTGLVDLDQILLGIEDEEYVIVAARPGQGKTSLLFDIARHNVMERGNNVALFSLEMSDEEVARRFISQEAEVDSTKIKTGQLTSDEWKRVNDAIEKYGNGGRIILFDLSNLTPAQLRAKCLKAKRMYDIKLVVVDYLGLMSSGVNSENRTREIGYISRKLKNLTQELKVPVIAASQMSRGVEQRTDKRPVLSDLRDSGDIEQDANVVIFLYTKDETTNVTEAIVAKRRDGKTGTASLAYRKEFTTFDSSSVRRFAPNERHSHTPTGSDYQ